MAMSFDPFSELDRLFGSRQGTKFMPVDLYSDGDRYVLNADMPGIDPGSVDIDVDGQLLTIRAERAPEGRDGTKWLTQERPHGSYLRQFNLGEGINSDHITADYDNGVLSLVIPLSERARPRKVQVSTSIRSERQSIAS